MMYYKAVRDIRPQAGYFNYEHDYTIKEFHDFMNYDLMIKWCAMILFDAVRDVRLCRHLEQEIKFDLWTEYVDAIN